MVKKTKKICKQLLPLALAAAFGVSALASCTKKAENDANTVEVYAFTGGYGVEWLKELESRYEARNKDVNIEIKSDGMLGKADAMVRTGELETTDLYFTTDSIMKWLYEGNGVVKGYDFVLEPLDDVYSYQPAGDGKTVEDLMHDSYKNNARYTYYDDDGNEVSHYYSVPWSGNVTGIVYNKTLFDEFGLSLPRTTKELWEVCDEIVAKGKVPFVSSTETGYTDYMLQTWTAQYMTVSTFTDFWRGIDADGKFGPGIWNNEAILYALNAYEKMLSPDVGYSHKNINTLTFTNAQAQILTGNCLMMVNGDWFENEMAGKGDKNYVLDIMSAPMLSDIADKTSFAGNAEKETILRNLISYIDGEATERPAEANDADEKTVRDARKVTYGLLNHNAYIPAYATAKETAKDFLKYLCTKEAFDVYLEKTGGAILPLAYEVNESGLSAMQQSKMKIYKKADYVPMYVSFPMAHTGGLSMHLGVNPERKFTAKDQSDRMTPQQIFDYCKQKGTQAYFDQIAQKAGLI